MSETLKFGTDGNWATKKGSLLAYNSENGNFKPLPFNFSRASSATVINKDGLIETVGSGQPRIDYKDDSKGALKLEPSRSNLITYSEDFTNAIWTNSNAATIVNPTANLSPDGTLSGNEFNEGSADARRGVYEDVTVSANTSYTLSVFVKKGTSDYLRLVIANGLNSGLDWTAIQVDLSNNSISTKNGNSSLFTDISSSISDTDYNGYYRLTLTAKHPTTTTLRVVLGMSDGVAIAGSNSIARRDYVGTNKYLYVWGVQLEEGSYATSYIPTQGSSVTRLADNIDTDFGTILPLSGEVSVYMEMLGQPVNETNVTGKISAVNFDDTTDSSSYVSLNFNGTDWRARVQAVGGSRFVSFEVDQTETIKALFVLRPTSYALYANGNLIGSEDRLYNEPAPVINEIAKVEFDNSTSDKGITRNKDLRVYNTALSNAEAIALTTL